MKWLNFGCKFPSKWLSFQSQSTVYLPKPKLSISGPGGIQATFDWQAAKNTAAGHMLTVQLVNDVVAY